MFYDYEKFNQYATSLNSRFQGFWVLKWVSKLSHKVCFKVEFKKKRESNDKRNPEFSILSVYFYKWFKNQILKERIFSISSLEIIQRNEFVAIEYRCSVHTLLQLHLLQIK